MTPLDETLYALALINDEELFAVCKSAAFSFVANKMLTDHVNLDDMVKIFTQPNIIRCKNNRLDDLILDLKSFMREKSHGAAALTRVFVTNDLLKLVWPDKTGTICIGGVEVISDTTLVQEVCKIINQNANLTVLSLCKPKFTGVPIEQLLAIGNICQT